MEVTKIDFVPSPGIILADPVLKTKKSDMMVVHDEVDDPHQAWVVAVGSAKPYDNFPTESMEPPCKIGDLIIFSIAGCEKTRLPYKGNPRNEFVIIPFGRVIGIITGENNG